MKALLFSLVSVLSVAANAACADRAGGDLGKPNDVVYGYMLPTSEGKAAAVSAAPRTAGADTVAPMPARNKK